MESTPLQEQTHAGEQVQGHGHIHELEHEQTHTHTHTHTSTRQVVNRLSRAIGHLESVKRMVEEGQDCSKVLVQLSAVTAALNSTSRIILKDHITHCLVDAAETGDSQTIEELTKAIDSLIK